jgi:hypothetical protein
MSTVFCHLPFHLQHIIFALAAAPLNTCGAAAEISQDDKLICQWLLAKDNQPLLTASKHKLWDVCEHIINTFQHEPDILEIRDSLPLVTMAGRSSLIGNLLKWCYHSADNFHLPGQIRESLKIAAARGDVQSCKQLITHPCTNAEVTRLAACQAARFGNMHVLQFLIDSCPDASSPGLDGSPMCCAAEGGHVAAMQLLMQHGADVNNAKGTPWSGEQYGSRLNFTPLQIAAARGHSEVIRWV